VRALPREGTSLPSAANALNSFGHTVHSSAQQENADIKTLWRTVVAITLVYRHHPISDKALYVNQTGGFWVHLSGRI